MHLPDAPAAASIERIDRAATTIASRGYHHMSPDFILSKVEQGAAAELALMPGNFVITVETEATHG